jgi:signal transduction histidine kinase/CheY-like chemotaxis protein
LWATLGGTAEMAGALKQEPCREVDAVTTQIRWARVALAILAVALLALVLVPAQFGALEKIVAVVLLAAAGILYTIDSRSDAAAYEALASARGNAEAQLEQVNESRDELERRIAGLRKQFDGVLESNRLLIDSFPDPVFIMDKNFRVSSINDAARKSFGEGLDETKPMYCYKAIHGRDGPCDPASHQCALLKGESCKEIQTLPGNNGEDELVEIRTTPLTNNQGEIVSAVEVIHRLNEQEKLALKLQRAKEEAETARRARSELVATLSHEVRTPMNAMLGMSDLLNLTDLTRKQQMYVSLIQSSGNLLLSLVDNMLGFAQLGAGNLSLREDEFSVSGLLEGCLEIMGYQAYSRGIELAGCLKDNQAARVVGDSERLRQIMINLISNAIKFTRAGEVIVKVAAERQADRSARLTVTVVDSGTGMSQDAKDALFKPFANTSEQQLAGRQQGSGLGLAISRELIELMGGTIEISSESGQGTTVSFSVPVRVSAWSEPEDETQAADLEGRRILVVHENPAVSRTLCDCLLGMGVRCDQASHPGEVTTRLGEAVQSGSPYDCIVVDAGLGGGRGLALARAIRALHATCDLPIILLTSNAHPLEVGEISAIGRIRCVNKPVLMSELRSNLLGLLGMEIAADEYAEGAVAKAPKFDILVAEDNPISRILLAGMLKSLGHKVATVDNGPAVLTALEDKPYDLILMDCQMPGMDGDEVTRIVRQRTGAERTQPVIVAITADVSPQHREKCLNSGMNEFLTKPIRLESLKFGLRRWMSVTEDENESACSAMHEPEPSDESDFLMRLRQRIGSFGDASLQRYIDLFLVDTASRLEVLRAALERRDLQAIRRECHALKGACLELGMTRMGRFCDSLREASRDERLEALPGALDGLTREFARIRPQIEAQTSRSA